MENLVNELRRLSYLAEFIKRNKNEDLKELEIFARETLVHDCLKLQEEVKKFKVKWSLEA